MEASRSPGRNDLRPTVANLLFSCEQNTRRTCILPGSEIDVAIVFVTVGFGCIGRCDVKDKELYATNMPKESNDKIDTMNGNICTQPGALRLEDFLGTRLSVTGPDEDISYSVLREYCDKSAFLVSS